jgi:DNA-directed RNA polymerase subunit RPC12/RpoP
MFLLTTPRFSAKILDEMGRREEDQVEQVIGTPARARHAVGAGLGNALTFLAGALLISTVALVVFAPLGVLCFLATPLVVLNALRTKHGECPRCDEPVEFVGKTHATCRRCTAKVFIKRSGELGVS